MKWENFLKFVGVSIIKITTSWIVVGQGESVYLRLPSEVAKRLKREYGIDFTKIDKGKDDISITCELVEDHSNGAPKLIYSFKGGMNGELRS